MEHPKYQDQYVRFRTTYYFRVYDYCRDPNDNQHIISDGLYRFRMTGKAHPLTTSVRFESGTLPKSVIEPFGSTIEYDPDSRRFPYRSFEDAQALQDHKDRLARAKETLEWAHNIDQWRGSESKASAELKANLQDLVAEAVSAAKREVVASAPPATPPPLPDP